MKLSLFGLQTPGTPGDIDANLAELTAGARAAKARGGEILVTPELFVTGYNIGDLVFQYARLDLVGMVQKIAREEGIAIVAGLPEYEAGHFFNTAIFVDEFGAELGRYRKTHLFGSLDRSSFTAGEQLVSTIDYRGVRIAMLICYDVEFPETARAVAMMGAHLILVPTAQMVPFEFIAEQVVRARAWENQIYVAYINHAGAESDLFYVGRSSIIDPYAAVLDSAVEETRMLFAVIDTDIVDSARAANPYLSDLRPDLYHRPAGPPLLATQPAKG